MRSILCNQKFRSFEKESSVKSLFSYKDKNYEKFDEFMKEYRQKNDVKPRKDLSRDDSRRRTVSVINLASNSEFNRAFLKKG